MAGKRRVWTAARHLMKTLYRRLTLALLLVVQAFSSPAQDIVPGLGHVSSFRSIGLMLSLTDTRDGSCDQLKLYTDLLSRWKSDGMNTGFALAYSHLMDIRTRDLRDCSMTFYAGPGVDVGYKADLDRGRGPVLAVSGEWGLRFDFDRAMSVKLGFTTLLGMHCELGDSLHTRISLYRYGLACSLMPQFTVIYRL